MTQFQKLLAFCHNGVGHGKASSFHPICWCVCACMCMCIPVLGSHQDIWVILQSCIGLPPGHLGDSNGHSLVSVVEIYNILPPHFSITILVVTFHVQNYSGHF